MSQINLCGLKFCDCCEQEISWGLRGAPWSGVHEALVPIPSTAAKNKEIYLVDSPRNKK